MSYDIWLEPRNAKPGGPWALSSRNYTYNAAPMFEAVTGGSLHDLHDVPCSEAVFVLEQAVIGMHVDAQNIRALEPANGWGNFEDFRDYVSGLWDWCIEAPEMIVKVG